LYIYAMCTNIRYSGHTKNPLKGIHLWEEYITISQYADDTYLFLECSEQSMKEAYSILKWFYDLSGFKKKTKKLNNMYWVKGGF
jgi:hypothetical protein